MLREILDAVLTKKQREVGLYLEELDDHSLTLNQGSVVRARFSQLGTTVLEIREEANKWVSNETK